MPSQIGGDNATILPVYTAFNGIDDYAVLNNDFINTASGYIEAYCKVVAADGYVIIFSSADKDVATNFLWVDIASGKARIVVRSASTFTQVVIETTNAISDGWHTIRWGNTGTAYYINVDSSPVAITQSSGTDTDKWFSSVANRDRIGIGCVARSTMILGKFKCAYVAVDTTNKWICNNDLYFYDIIGDLHVPINKGSTTVRAFDNIYGHCLEKGYSSYIYIAAYTENIFQVPHKDDGSALTTPTIPANWEYVEDVAGDSSYHNLADSMIDIPPAQWDTSDLTQCKAAAQSAWYNAATPNRWHITYLHRDDMNAKYYNDGYNNLTFAKMTNNSVSDRQLLKDIFSYSVNKTGDDLEKILLYTNDYRIRAGVALSFDDTSRLATWVNGNIRLRNKYRWRFTGSLDLENDAAATNIKTTTDAMIAHGHTFANHTENHVNGDDYITANGEQAYYDDEIIPCQTRIEDILLIPEKIYHHAYMNTNPPALNALLFAGGFTQVRRPNLDAQATFYDGSSQVIFSNGMDYLTIEQTLAAVEYAKNNNLIIPLHGHSLGAATNLVTYTLSYDYIEELLEYVCDNHMTFYTTDELLPSLFE
jgi:hypothetical protein